MDMKISSSITLLLALAALILFHSESFSQPQPDWAKKYNGASNSTDEALAMAIDKSSNSIVTGRSFAAGSSYNIVTVKYSPSGIQQWAVTFNGTANGLDEGVSIATDDSGNVFVAGRTFISSNNYDIIVIKYNTAGTFKWSYTWGGTAGLSDYAMSLHVDSLQNIYVTGGTRLTGSNINFVTFKLNSSGSPVWNRTYGHSSNQLDEGLYVSSGQSGAVYVSGRSVANTTGEDFMTIKYNSTGDTVWTKRYSSISNLENDVLKGFCLDRNENVYVTGSSRTDTNGTDYITIKYNSSGSEQWRKIYTSPGNSQDIPSDIAVDGSGNVVVTGSSRINSPYNDIVTLKYNSSGAQIWFNTYNNTGEDLDDMGSSISVDENSNVYVAGSSMDLGGIDTDPVIIKYNSSGNQQWVVRYDSAYDEAVYNIGLDQSGSVIVSGYTADANQDYLTVKYSQLSGMSLNLTMFIQGLYNPSANSQVSDTVVVQLRNASFPYAVADSGKSVIGAGGTASFSFLNAPDGSYYIVAKHRNTIETWSSVPVAMSDVLTANFDLSSGSSQAFGGNILQVDVSPVRYAVYSGDVDQDGTVDATDVSLIDNNAQGFVSGYIVTDLTGDDFVDGTDFAIADNNAGNFVSLIRP